MRINEDKSKARNPKSETSHNIQNPKHGFISVFCVLVFVLV